MKNKRKKCLRMSGVIAAVLIVFFFAGCNLGLTDPDQVSDDTAAAEPAPSEDVETGLRLTISRFSPWLQDAISEAEPAEVASRAMAAADSFTVIVYDSSDAEVHNQSYTPVGDGAISETQSCTIALDAGSGYSVEVKVYNNDNANDGGLVVQGTAENITITDGETTSVSVACTPVYPIGFTIGIPSSTIGLTATEMDGYQLVDPGEEFWMIFQAPASGAVRVTPELNGTTTCSHVIGVYDSAGEPVKSFFSTPPTTDSVLVEGLSPGATYYGLYLPLSEIRETVNGTILIEEVQPGDCGYAGVDARSVSGTVDFSAFDISGVTVTAVKVFAMLLGTGGSTEGFQIIDSADFTDGFTADYSLVNMDPSLSYNIYYQVIAEYDGTEYQPYLGPNIPDISSGDITGYDYTFAEAYIAEITVNMTYTGAGTVDANHPLVISMDLTDHGYMQDTEYLYTNSGQIVLEALVAQSTVYVEAAYWATGGEDGHDDWDPMCFYGETAADRTPDAINISSSPVTIDFTLDDTIRFNVDDEEAYPLDIDGTWYGPLDGFGDCIHTFAADSDFLYTFATDDNSYWETYRIWEWDNATGFFVLQMLDCSDPTNSGIGKYFPSGWENLSGVGADATMDMFGYGDGTDYYILDSLEEARAADRSSPMAALPVSASPPATGTLSVTIQ